MFERIKSLMERLQNSYESKNVEETIRLHSMAIKEGLNLIVESDSEFKESDALTSVWSDIGTEGAAALLKSVELAERYDSEGKVVPMIDRVFLLNLAAIENYRCGRHGIAAAVIRRGDTKVPETYSKSPTGRIVSLLRSFCTGNLQETWDTCETLKREVTDQLSNLGANDSVTDSVTVQLLLSLSSVVELLLTLRRHLETGDQVPIIKEKWLSNIVKFSQNSGDGEYQLFAESFVRAFRSLEKLSIWNIRGIYLGENNVDSTFMSWARHRVESGMPFLFPSQYEALISHKSLLHNQELITMPTGGGKTLVSEVFIVLSQIKSPEEKCLYIVPTRALAAEKRDDLTKALSWANSPFSVCQMTGDIAFDVKDALAKNNVIVLTPEKFDILMRNQFYGNRICALVVDEFHTIKSSYRGIKLQLSIKRFQKNFRASVLYISAILRNSDLLSLSKWVNSPDPFSTEWRPTPSRIGVVSVNDRPTSIVSFNDGTFKEIPDLDGIRVDAGNKVGIKIVKTFLETEHDQVLHFNLTWRTYKRGENRLIELANDYMKEFKGEITFEPRKLKEISAKFSRLVGANDPLALAFRKGIAVHWGELPHIARNLEENAIKEKAIGLILSTSTLAEGVNLPIKTIYLPKLSTRKGPLEKGLFLNIIGRAGRPYFHPEGQVVIAYNEAGRIVDRTPKAKAVEYANTSSEDVEHITTSIVDTGRAVEEMIKIHGIWSKGGLEPTLDWEMKVNDFQKRVFQRALAEVEALSSSLLACVIEGLISDVNYESIEDLVFLGPESDDQRQLVKKLIELVQKRLYHFEILHNVGNSVNVTPWGKVVYMTGLGPVSCQKLRVFAIELLSKQIGKKIIGRDITKGRTESNLFAKELLKAIHLPLEKYVFGYGEFRPIDEELLLHWIAGLPLEEISKYDSELEGNFLKTFMKLEGVLSGYASWVLDSIHLISKLERVEPSITRNIHAMAVYTLYGHFDRYVIKLLEKDVNKTLLRDDIITLRESLPTLKDLFENKYDAEILSDILTRAKRRTRMEERYVADSLVKLAS